MWNINTGEWWEGDNSRETDGQDTAWHFSGRRSWNVRTVCYGMFCFAGTFRTSQCISPSYSVLPILNLGPQTDITSRVVYDRPRPFPVTSLPTRPMDVGIRANNPPPPAAVLPSGHLACN